MTSVTGIVRDDTGTAVGGRTVRVYNRSTGGLLSSTVTSAGTGPLDANHATYTKLLLLGNGAGVLAGISSAYGIGTLNYTTGSLLVTLGALPDVGSSIVIQSYSDLETTAASNTMLLSPNAYFTFNSSGVEGGARGSAAFPRKALIINWTLNGVTKYVHDATGMGLLVGDGTGTIDYGGGTVTFTDVTGYSQPVTIEHRIEDMAVVREAQISGEITFTRALTHDYPITNPPTSFVSSALVAGDLRSRVSYLFDQATWNGTTWLDAVSGAAATGTFNDALAPIVVTNTGTVSERWSMVFTNSTAFNIVGEHVGVIGTGTINADCAPLNPATGVPYFSIPALGWGLGWAVGNVLRFNTVGAMFPVWVVRTIQQGPESVQSDKFTILVRGDVDRP